MQDKYKLDLPSFPGTSQCVKISGAAVDVSQVEPVIELNQHSLSEIAAL